MKNDYEIRGEVTAIFIDRKDGTRLETIIDTVDLEKAQAFPRKWCAIKPKSTNSYYIFGRALPQGGKQKGVLLHRFLTDAPDGFEVDHINRVTLDNRRSSNLRIVTHANNQQNRSIQGNRKSRSNYRGVGWDEANGKWRASCTVNGKTKYFGRFTCQEKAAQVVAEARKKYMTHSVEV